MEWIDSVEIVWCLNCAKQRIPVYLWTLEKV